MPLYTKRKPGLYTTGGDWSDPGIWTDETGAAANKVPTSSDDVYVMGSVTGSGSAANIVVSENPPGMLIRARPDGLYTTGGDWSDPGIWTDKDGTAVNKTPTSADNVFVTGSVTGSGQAANITVGTLEEIGYALAISDACCCDKCGKCCWRITGRSGSSAEACPPVKVTVLHGAPPGLRLDFSDSENCDGPCPDAQFISLETKYETKEPVTLTVDANGLVESQNNPFDTLTVNVNGTQVLFIEAFNDLGGCGMKSNSGSGSIELEPGCHTITVAAGTNDGFFHVGFFYEITFSVSGGENTDTCDSKICNTYNCDEQRGCIEETSGGTGTYATLAECEENCDNKERYYCNQYQGCRPTYDPSAPYASLTECEESGQCDETFKCDDMLGCTPTFSGQFVTEAACLAACKQFYECGFFEGSCFQPGTYSVDGMSLTDCQAVCFERYNCGPSGCTSTGFAVTGNTLTECQQICTIQSYRCDYYEACQPRYDASGEFADSAACAAGCKERANCDPSSGCQNTGFGTSGLLFADCATECTIQSYRCDYYAACQPRYDASGEFADSAACAAGCKERANCDPSSGCQNTGFGTSGLLYSDCGTECVIQSYTCNPQSGCQGLYGDASGQFATQAACASDCLGRYTCQLSLNSGVPSSYCGFIGYNITGQTQAECEPACVIGSYTCDASDGCWPALGNSGEYATQEDCRAVCTYHYDCIDYGGGSVDCRYTGFQTGGASYAACLANCPQPMTMREAPDMQKWLAAARGVQAAPNNTAEYPRYFVSARPVFPPKPLQEEDPDGPGTMLSGMLEKVGIKSSPTCSCKARARIMNVNGNDWCAENLALLIGWLREEAQKRKLPFIDIAGRLIIKRAISLSRAAKRKNTQK